MHGLDTADEADGEVIDEGDQQVVAWRRQEGDGLPGVRKLVEQLRGVEHDLLVPRLQTSHAHRSTSDLLHAPSVSRLETGCSRERRQLGERVSLISRGSGW